MKSKIVELLDAQIESMDAEEINSLLEIPPKAEMGDFAFPCFKLAKVFRNAPPMIAADLKEKIGCPDFLNKVECLGGYLNFFVDKSMFAKQIVENYLADHNYGGSDATPTMQAPKYAQPGQKAQELNLILELKVIADVGLVGFPNVGKSTFLARVTNAKPKIANYHFTTLSPNLGVVDLDGSDGFVIADIPGIIEGASEGVGLGHEFLRHIERTRVIIHIVDAAGVEGRDPINDIHMIQKELAAYNELLAGRPQVIAANKIDALYEGENDDAIQLLKEEFEPQAYS